LKLGLALGFGLWLGLVFTFSTFLPSLQHSCCALLSRYRWWFNKVSNMKNHRWFYSHCFMFSPPTVVQQLMQPSD